MRLTPESRVLALALLVAWPSPGWAQDDGYGGYVCPIGTNADYSGDGESCDEAGLVQEDPVNMADGTTVVRRKDIEIRGSVANLKLFRTYSPKDDAWKQGGGIAGRAQPFNDLSHWRHNFWSYTTVIRTTAGLVDRFSVRNTNGRHLQFQACSPFPCWAAPEAYSTKLRYRLEAKAEDHFILWAPGNERFEYRHSYIPPSQTRMRDLFLSKVYSATGILIASLDYGTPLDVNGAQLTTCLRGPYLRSVTNEDGTTLQFQYEAGTAGTPPLTQVQCGISRVVVADAAGVTTQLASYDYQRSPGGALIGDLKAATTPNGVESYTYSRLADYIFCTPQFCEPAQRPVPAFSMKVDGETRFEHQFDISAQTLSGCGFVSAISSPQTNATMAVQQGPQGQCQWSLPFSDPVCQTSFGGGGSGPPGVFFRTVTDSMTPTQKLIRTYGYVGNYPEVHEPRLLSIQESCVPADACSPGTRIFQHLCGVGEKTGLPLTVKDKRDFLTRYAYATPAGNSVPANWARAELVGRASGASISVTPPADVCTSALDCETYGYTGDETTGRLLSSVQRKVASGGGALQTVRSYEYSGSRVSAVVESGQTRDINGQPVSRHRKTFYRTTRTGSGSCDGEATADPLGRTLEIEGPCWVDGPSSTTCTSSPAPLEQRTYWPQNAPGFNAGRLKTVKRYPSGCTSEPLATNFLLYDALGNATAVTDPNGVMTILAYQGTRLTQKTIAGKTWRFFYSADKLIRTEFPEGNQEIFCYQSGTADTGCQGGTATGLLQWKAKAADSLGEHWSERVDYEYQGGAVAAERYKTCATSGCGAGGEVRRERHYALDAHRRTRLERMGSAPDAPAVARAHDGADNLTGLGRAFNAAPTGCGGVSSSGAPADPRCNALSYDGLNRLTEVVDRDGDASQPVIKTCFSYDVAGNISRVVSGCRTTSTCAALPTACTDNAAHYEWDDFHNLIKVTLPTNRDAAGTPVPTRYEFDALGNVVAKAGADTEGGVLRSTYDGLGRLLRTESVLGGQATSLVRFFYDSAQSAGGHACRTLANTVGRMVASEDSGGRTWYSYDAEGRLVAESRADDSASAVSLGSRFRRLINDASCTAETTYEYTPNGNLKLLEYPHGRSIQYVYGTSRGLNDRVVALHATFWDGSQWLSRQLLSNVTWEPYAGLRRYEYARFFGVIPPSGSSTLGNGAVEYILLSDGSGRASQVDVTQDGAEKLSWRYGWAVQQTPEGPKQTDQLAQVTTRANGADVSTQSFDYNPLTWLTQLDGTLGEFAEYDARGNRTKHTIGSGREYRYDYPASQGRDDVLSSITPYLSNVALGPAMRTYTHDAAGRATRVAWRNDSSGQAAWAEDFAYSLSGVAAGASVFKTVTLSGGPVYGYHYDAFGRRRKKEYPVAGAADEFFYDSSRQLLEDKGVNTLVAPAPYPLDEYIWLDSKPVVMVRSQLGADGTRLHSNFDSDIRNCARNGEKAGCGVYYLVNDILPKPVAMLNAQGRIVGLAEYQAFGQVNRRALWADTQHPYDNNTERYRFGEWVHPNPQGANLETKIRVRFDVLDTEACGSSKFDPVHLVDGDSGADLAQEKYGGHHQGDTWTNWVTPPASGHLALTFSSNWRNRAPSPPSSSTCQLGGDGWPYFGASVREYEYRRFDKPLLGLVSQPLFTPLRFPGQYFDEESGLTENWHRMYASDRGGYSSRELMLDFPSSVLDVNQLGAAVDTYSYGHNNPTYFSDPSGLFVRKDPCGSWTSAVALAMKWAGCKGGGAGAFEPNTECQYQLQLNGACNICKFLEDGIGPDAYVRSIPVGGGTGHTNVTGYYAMPTWHPEANSILFHDGLCSDPEDLARIMIREASHYCATVTRKIVLDGATSSPGTCAYYGDVCASNKGKSIKP